MKARTPLTLLLLAAFLATHALAGSAGLTPTAIAAGDRCHRCDRLISDRWVAGEAVGHGNVAYKFRTVRCMLTYLKDAPVADRAIFVADAQTGSFVKAEKAVFVPVSIDSYTGEQAYGLGETDYIAFTSASVAEDFARAHGVVTMSWPAVTFHWAYLPVTVGESP